MAYVEQPIAQSASFQAPVAGWRTDLPEDAMPPTAALIMDNIYSDGANVFTRGGDVLYSTVSTSQVDTLAQWTWQGDTKLLAASDGEWWDITVGSTPVSLASGFTSNQWQQVNHNNFLIVVNGTDPGQKYDGTTMTAWTPSFLPAGISTNDLITLGTYKERIFACEKNSLNVWYGDPQAIQGEFKLLPLSSLAERGGTLVAVGTYSSDTGAGPDDYICFFTSGGEMIVYTGLDPGNAASWALVGVYTLARPLGLRPYGKPRASNGIIITEHGYVTVTEIIAGVPDVQRAGRPVENAVVAAHARYETNFGWEVTDYSHGNYIVFNVPDGTGGADFVQHIYHGSGTWARFTNQNARTWIEWQDRLFYGAVDGKIYEADQNFNDHGQNIEFDAKTAYQYMGSRTLLKRFQGVRPTYRSLGNFPVTVDFDVDFEDQAPPYQSNSTITSGTPWGSPWGSPWATPVKLTKDWLDVRGEGYCGALRLRGSTFAQPFVWYSWDTMFQVGGIL